MPVGVFFDGFSSTAEMREVCRAAEDAGASSLWFAQHMGYRDAMKQAGFSIDDMLIAAGDYTTDTGIKCARELLSLDHPPTAIFASNDQMAMGVYQVAGEMGLRIPEDLSVVGFDNIMESKYMGLTTVDQFISEMGFVATQMLIKLINGETLESPTYQMQTQLVIRTSCRALNGHG